MNDYQFDYAAGKPQMYDKLSREQKALRIIKTLDNFFSPRKTEDLSLLDIGSSTGIIDNILASKFKKVTGVDIDVEAVKFAQKKFKRKNLDFLVGDAMKLPFRNARFDVVICSQVYEHVPSVEKLFLEIYRVLKLSGVCYLTAQNRIWPWEAHYNLPFLAWLPKALANLYVKVAGRAEEYYENPRTYWGLRELTKNFKRVEYTQKILREPYKFGYADTPNIPLKSIAWFFSPFSKYLSPTFFWILEKDKRKTKST